MFHFFKRKTVEKSEKVVEEGEMKELQKEKESENLSVSEDNSDFTSGSMLAIGANVEVPRDPENSGSEQSSEEEFSFLPISSQRYLKYLEDDLIYSDFSTPDQTDASDDNSSTDIITDHSNESNENHDSSSHHSDNHCHDDDGNDDYNDYVILQNQEVHTDGVYLHILQNNLDENYPKVVEESEKPVEGKEEQEEHKEYKAKSQWKDPLSSSTLVDSVPMSASRDPEIDATSEQSFDEEIVEVQDNLSLIPHPDLDEKVQPEPSFRSLFSILCFCFPVCRKS